MKLAKTNKNEIEYFQNLLRELEQLHSSRSLEFPSMDQYKINKERYPILNKVYEQSKGEREAFFFQMILSEIAGIDYDKILWNLITLLEKCSDPNSEHLDFSPEIKRILSSKVEREDKKEELYYIRAKDKGYSGDSIIWWRPGQQGYTYNLDGAGKYTEEEAKEICSGSKEQLAYLCSEVDNCEQKISVVTYKLPNKEAIQF